MSEFTLPLVLLVVGLLINGAAAFWVSGTKSAGLVMGVTILSAAVQTVLGIGAAYLTAAIIGTSFGELRSAFLKLAAVIVLSSAIGAVVPMGGFLVLFVYFGLLNWLFDLEMYEVIVFAVVFAIIRFVVLDLDELIMVL